MADDTQIQVEGEGSIKSEHGVFKNVLYGPSLVANMLSIYQMTHTGSPKQVVFGHDSVEISKYLNWEDYSEGCCKPCLQGI